MAIERQMVETGRDLLGRENILFPDLGDGYISRFLICEAALCLVYRMCAHFCRYLIWSVPSEYDEVFASLGSDLMKEVV